MDRTVWTLLSASKSMDHESGMVDIHDVKAMIRLLHS